MHSERQLTDTERKVVRVLMAVYKNKPETIDLDKISRLTQRKQADVLKAIKSLAELGRVTWDPKTRVVQVHWAEVLTLPFDPRRWMT
ncbi:hypothetical protein [Paenibacillus cymbidii]|uniref:hypothetical protein n=1 Tax=Paenibacillus cymbidii TaxID=1639034 RepID=UPI0010807B05|nr:hypothetical protein [Paenibacillus cymbidii]